MRENNVASHGYSVRRIYDFYEGAVIRIRIGDIESDVWCDD